MSLPFEDALPFESLPFEEEEPEKSYAKRVLTESGPAVLNLIPDMINAGVSGLMGAGEAAGGFVRGRGVGESIGRGVETFERGMESMREPGRPGIPRFQGTGVEESQQAISGLIDEGMKLPGNIGERMFMTPQQRETQLSRDFPREHPMKPGMEDFTGQSGGRSLAEAATNFLPVLPAVKGFRGTQAAKTHHMEAQKLLERKMAGESEYGSWEAEQAKNVEYTNALRDLDNEMIQYGKNLQAPQLGLGGKVAKHEDQIGKRERGEFASQMAWDEEIRKTGEDYQGVRDAAHEEAIQPGVDHLGQYGPTTKGDTLDHAPSPVRPYQIEQTRPGRISEGEATQIYQKPAFERTAEDRLKLIEYEESLRGPDIDSVKSEVQKQTIDTDKVDIETNKHLDAFLKSNQARGRGDVLYDRDGKPIDFPYKEGGYVFTEFKKDLDARGIKLSDAAARAMFDASQPGAPKPQAHPSQATVSHASKIPGLDKGIKERYHDTRTYEEMIESVKEAGDVTWMMGGRHIVTKILHGRFVAQGHPAWSWVSSQVHDLKSSAMQMANDRMHGKSHKQPSPGTANYTWNQLNSKDRIALNEFGWEFNNKDTPADVSKLSPKQREAFKERVAINHKMLDDVNAEIKLENEARKASGLESKTLLRKMPNYWSPSITTEPFVVLFKDKAGETRSFEGSYLKPNMKEMQAEAAKHGWTAELAPERGSRANLDFEQFEWMLRHLEKKLRDPAAKAISEALRRQGFMARGMKRKRDTVTGGMGSQGGRKGLRQYEEIYERNVRQAYEWISNKKLDRLYKKIKDDETLNEQPFVKSFALEAIDTARGGTNEHFQAFSNFVGDVVSGGIQIGTLGTLKLPRRFAKDTIQVGNKVKTTQLLGFGNLPFIGANLLQSGYAMPAMLAEAARMGKNTITAPILVAKAMLKAGDDLLKWDKSPDAQKLKEIGAFEATWKYDWSKNASEVDPRYTRKWDEALTGISMNNWVEANAVRRPAALMFLNFLREAGYKGDDIHYIAKEMTDKYMTSMKWYERPQAFSRTGIVGTAVGPLQSFVTTWLGMFREYIKMSAEGLLEGSLVKQLPLTSFLAMNVLSAGLMGVIGIKEWDLLAAVINKYTNYNMISGSEWVLSKYKNDKVRFGVLSDAMGVHIGATLAAPTASTSIAPGLQGLYDTGNFAVQMGKYGANKLGLTNAPPQAAEMRDAIKGVAPRFNWWDRAGELAGIGSTGYNWADIEKSWTPRASVTGEELPVQTSEGDAGPRTRNTADWDARKLGTHSLDEVKDRTEYYIAKREGGERSKRLSSAVSKAADILVMNPDDPNIMDRIEPIIAGLEEDQFSGRDIKMALKRELMSKYLESDVRLLGKGRSSRQAYVNRLLEQLR